MVELRFLVMIALATAYDPNNQKPSIVFENEDLKFLAARDKNISISTNGKDSFVNIVGVRVRGLIGDVKKSAKTFKHIQTDFSKTAESISKLQVLLDNNTEIFKNLKSINGSTSQKLPRNFLKSRRRLSSLIDKFRDMNLRLTSNKCSTTPCKNGGTCIDSYDKYICLCNRGWEGTDCSNDINECQLYEGMIYGCQNGGTCTNLPGTYYCSCAAGWFGLNCNAKSQSCDAGTSLEICGHGTCIPHSNGISCLCELGWKTSGSSPQCTVDVDECSGNYHPCSAIPFVPCVNTLGSFKCGSCPAGYSGPGYYCIDIDECQENNGGCSTNPTVQCRNTIGSRVCEPCPAGFEGDGITCTYKGLCEINNGGCSSLAKCTANPGISPTLVRCICSNGFTGTGVGSDGCLPISNLLSNNTCSPKNCLHGACLESVHGVICFCDPKYTGNKCDQKINPCDDQPCQNGGKCAEDDTVVEGYRCKCTDDFTGRSCQNQVHACSGTRYALEGNLTFPDSNYNSKKESYCSWTIETDQNKVINVTFSRFKIKDSTLHGCTHDWLEIYDGKYSSYNKIGRFCGRQLTNNTVFTSTHNAMLIIFQSADLMDHYGFELHWKSVEPTCGGLIENQEEGEVKSPGYPGPYPQHRDCYWLIQAKPQNRIEFSLNTLNAGAQFDCDRNYLKFFDGPSNVDPELVRICGSRFIPKIESSGRNALVYFHSGALDENSTAQVGNSGFKFSFKEIAGISQCGGIFKGAKGDITTPSLDGLYEKNIDCEYEISPESSGRLKLTFVSFEIEESRNCEHGYLKIYDGDSTESKSTANLCGNTIPDDFYSTSNKLYIVFKSTAGKRNANFRLHYELLCNQVLTKEQGILYSPDFPKPYPINRHCTYLIRLPPKSAIILEFSEFDVDDNSSPHCQYSFLKIYDGDSADSPLLGGPYCGSKKPSQVISTHNSMFLEFNSDSMGGAGWKANYTFQKLECGEVIKNITGEYTFTESDHLTNPYKGKKECKWILTAPAGHIIQVTMKEFNLKSGAADSPRCYKYLEIYEYYTQNNIKNDVRRFCDTDLPSSFNTYSNSLILKFHSNGSSSASSFTFAYKFIKTPIGCDIKYSTSIGAFPTLIWPIYYSGYKECAWVIQLKKNRRIQLDFHYYDVGGTCDKNYLEIRAGDYSGAPLIEKYCKNVHPSSIISPGNALMLRFVMPIGVFSGSWKSVIDECGGILEDSRGVLSSPNFPESFEIGTECLWRVTTSHGSSLILEFQDLILFQDNQCIDDYVAIYNSVDTETDIIGKYCAFNETSKVVKSKSNYVLVKFKGTNYLNRGGFLLNCRSECNTNIYGFSGAIESLDFPNEYPPGVKCTWKIGVPSGNRINITFSHFELEDSDNSMEYTSVPNLQNIPIGKNCTDLVQIKDQKDEKYGETNTFCGFDIPQMYTSSDNVTYIHFETDQGNQFSGFRLEWTIFGCGGHLKSSTGNLTGGDQNNIMRNRQCDWIIEVEEGNSVEFVIRQYEIEALLNSNEGQSIVVYEGMSRTNKKLLEFHKNVLEDVTYTSGTNSMFVSVVSNDIGLYFSASYSAKPLKCGGKFSTPNGIIFSQNYPNNYAQNSECNWHIAVEIDHSIEFSFNDFDLIDSINCTDYINVYEGHIADNSSLLLKKCGSDLKKETIVSTTNQLLIKMITGSSSTARGFQATYTTLCGKTIRTASDGYLEPNPTTWIGNHRLASCKWTIIGTDLGDHVSLTFSHMDLYNSRPNNSTACPDQYVEVFNGESSDAPSLGKFCGNKIPHTIVSHGNSLSIVLSPITIPKTLFAAEYSVLSSFCGGVLTSEEGKFASPKYPNTYPMNSDCEWQLTPSPGNKVMLTFLSFNVGSDNCELDYLEIRQNNGVGTVLNLYCGDKLPPAKIYDTSLWIKFHSTEGSTGPGFLIEYSYVHGNVFEDLDHGSIASPMYSYFYSNSGLFNWRIDVNLGATIQLNVDKLSFPEYNRESCSTYLAIYDGYDNKAPMLLKKCENTIPPQIISTSHIVYVEFNSHHDPRGSFFHLHWNKVDEEDSYSISTCGSNTTIVIPKNSSHILRSPGYPDGYEKSLNCTWTFITDPTRHLALKFNDISLEQSDDCSLDQVNVYSERMDNLGWNQIGTFCINDETPKIVESDTNMMKVEFATDASVDITGFEAWIYPVCGGNVSASSGILESFTTPNESMPTSNKGECVWIISTRPGTMIDLQFVEIDLPMKNGRCDDDYIMIKNGMSANSPILGKGKYCDKEAIDNLQTSGNFLYVKYYYNKNKKQRGTFKLHFEELSINCGHDVILSIDFNSTIIYTPNYPEIPNTFSDCEWTFRAPPGERIRLDFLERFDLTEDDNCPNEFAEIRDGGTINSGLIAKLCGSKMPPTQKSTGNMLYIRFLTAVTDPKNGFKAQVSIDICGGTYTDSGILKAPNKLQLLRFSSTVECEWRLIAEKTHNLVMNLDMSMPISDRCDDANIQILDLIEFNNTEHTTTEKLCGVKKSFTINSMTNVVVVKMMIKKYSVKNLYDFQLSYESSLMTCGGELTANEGVLESLPMFTSATSRACFWTIRVEEGRMITLKVLQGYRPENFNYVTFYSNLRNIIRIPVNLLNTNVVESYSNTMKVILYMNGSKNYVQFRASYTSDKPSGCGPKIRSQQGSIESVGSKLSAFECEYSLEIPQNYTNHKTMVITLSNLQFGGNKMYSFYCPTSQSVVEIRLDTYAFHQICQDSEKPIIIRSPFRVSNIYIRKNTKILNYKIDYKVVPCGNTIDFSGMGDSTIDLKLPENYTGPVDCVWSITIPNDYGTSQITLSNMTLTNDDCKKEDYTIKSLSKYFSISRFAKGWCEKAVTSLNITSRQFYLEYHSDRYYNTTSLKLKFEFYNNRICGGIEFTEVHTPNFPASYGNNLNCLWNIIGIKDYRIQLFFLERFAVEQSPNCTKDFVEILDLEKGNWVSKMKLCGRDMPDNYTSNTSQLNVRFVSDSSITNDGFKAGWNLMCGGVYLASSEIQTIDNPLLLNRDLYCEYIIKVPSDERLNLTFTTFNLTKGCQFENLTISRYSEDEEIDEKPRSYCDDKSPGTLFTNEDVKIIYRKQRDGWGSTPAYAFNFNLNNCGGIINHSQIISIIPEDRTNYKCIWNITAPEDKVVSVKFRKFHLNSFRCKWSYLKVFEGSDIKTSENSYTLCGDLNYQLPTLKSKTNQMILYLQGIRSFKPQFEATILFVIACGDTLFFNSTHSHTFEIEKDYDEFLDCEWQAKVPDGNIIHITFTRFGVTPCRTINNTSRIRNKCDCDFFEVRDGGPRSSLISKSCGNQIPGDMVSSGNQMWMRFFSDATLTGLGVEAVLTAEPLLCGKSVLEANESVQIFTPPSDADGYVKRGLRCVWNIPNPEEVTIRLRFVSVDLEPLEREECNLDFIEIMSSLQISEDKEKAGTVIKGIRQRIFDDGFDEHEFWERFRYVLCGQHKESFIYIHSGDAKLTLMTSNQINTKRRGFKLEYAISGCSENYTSESGRIVISNIQNETGCIIFIKAKKNYTISLYVRKLTIDNDDAVFSVRDGNSEWDRELSKKINSDSRYAPYFSSGNTMRIKTSLSQWDSIQFEANYVTTDKGQGCGGQINDHRGIIYSPLYPLPYRGNVPCEWTIQTPDETFVNLKFKEFDLGPLALCDVDYLELYDKYGTRIAKYCREDRPVDYTGKNNFVKIVQHASNNNGGPGWVITFNTKHYFEEMVED